MTTVRRHGRYVGKLHERPQFRDMANWGGITAERLVATHLSQKPNTARGYRQDLLALAAWMEVDGLPQVAETLIDNGRAACKCTLMTWITNMRAKNLAANTIRRRVAAVTSMVGLAQDLEVIGWTVGRLKNLPPAVRVRDCRGPDLGTVERMFDACRDRWDHKGARDEAILGLLYWHARRASEVLSIQMSDVDMVAKTVRIITKRGQGRMTLQLCQRAVDLIARWIELRGDEDGPLFNRCRRWGRKVMSKPLTYWGLRGVIRKLGVGAGCRCWPHALRHSAITHMGDLTGNDPIWGCALSGHKDMKALGMYQDRTVSHVSAAEILSRGQIVRREPHGTDN